MFQIKCCDKCKNNSTKWNAGDVSGFFEAFLPSDDFCPYCHNELKNTNLSYDDFKIIKQVSTDKSFIEAMIKLHDTDIIEYETKMSHFRNQVEQQKQAEQIAKQSNIPHCPTCSSTDIKKISVISKAGSVAMWGLFSRKVDKQWHCNSCGSEW